MDFWKEKFKYIFVQHKYKTTWRAIATFMAAVVVFVTTYGMILPAITMETEIAEEMPGIQLEHNAEPEQMVEDDLSDGLTGGSGIPETSVESQDSEGITGQDSTVADDGKDEAPGAALLTAKTEKSEAVISNVSGEMFPGGMSLSIKELKKEGFEYTAYRPIAQNKASSDEEEPGDWSDCDTRIFDLRFIDVDGFEVIPSQEMKAEIRFIEPVPADLCKIVLLTDERDDLTGDPTVINADSVRSRNNHTLELIRDGNNEVTGFRFRAEAISLVAFLSMQVEAEPDVEMNGEPEEEIVAEQGTETEAAEEMIAEPETDPAEETTTEAETDTESTENTESNSETDEVQEEESPQDVTTDDETAGEQEEETGLEEAVNPDEEAEPEEAEDTTEESEDQKDHEVTETKGTEEETIEVQETEEAEGATEKEEAEESVDNADEQKEETEDTVDDQKAEESEDSVDEEEATETEDVADEEEAEESEDSVGEQEVEETEDTADKEEEEESEDTTEEREASESEDTADEEEEEESENTSEGQDSEDNDSVEETEEADEAEQSEEELSLTYPAQEFLEETEFVHVYVKAGIGAFPAGTTMKVEDVDDDETIAAIEEAVEQNVSKVHAVNISFYAPEDTETEIQPLIPVQVIIKAEESKDNEEIKVVHVDDDGNATEVETVKPEDVEEKDGEAQATIIEPGTGEDTTETSTAGLDGSEDTNNQETDLTVNTDDQTDESETVSEDDSTVAPEEQAVTTTSNSDDQVVNQTVTPEESENSDVQSTDSTSDTVTQNPTIRMNRIVRSSALNSAPSRNVAETETQVDSTVASEDLFSGSDDSTELVSFYAGGFSIYALVYTVDFHWEVDGNEYKFDLTGGGTLSLRELVKALHIIKEDTDVDDTQTTDEQSDEENVDPADTSVTEETITQIDKFISDIESVRFSNESLVKVTQITENTTAGQLKENLSLQPEYSAELTEEQIAEMDAKAFTAPDWALISLKAFNTEESLTIAMKTGEVFTIKVTDAQIKKTVISASGETYEITVTYDDSAEIPEGAELKVREILPEDEEYKKFKEDVADNFENPEIIPAHPVLFDISIMIDNVEVEPAEGSEVRVEVKLIQTAISGAFTDQDSPLLINDAPVTEEIANINQSIQIIHQVEEGQLEIMDTIDSIDEDKFISEFITDSFSNWLIYLDEDLEEIEIGEGDTITLREFSEWIWHKDEENPGYEGAKWRMFHNNQFLEPTHGDVNSNGVISFQKYTRNVNEDEIHENYDIFHGRAIGQGEIYLYKVNESGQAIGKRLKIKVTQNGSAAPSQIPDSQIADVKVNLFDYNINKDLDVSGNVASSWDWRNAWNDWYGYHQAGYYDYNGVRYSYQPYEKSINTYSDLKFLGWGSSDSSQDKYGLNSYTANAPLQEIVKDILSNDVPVLSDTYGGDSLGYLFNTNSNSEEVKAYPNVGGLFQKDSKGYYYYNSNQNYAYYNGQKIVLYNHTYTQVTKKNNENQPSSKPIGFFPFHPYNDAGDLSPNHDQDLNHHFGMSMSVPFALPEDKLNQGEHIIYEFSGDDDLWVFIDGKLALDIGGVHQPLRGYIDFTDGKVYVYGVNSNIPQEVDWIKNLTPGVEHTLDMFYIERGGCDSNLSVKYNIPLIIGKADVTVVKEGVKKTPDETDILLPGAKFGIWENENCNGSPLRTAVSNASGVVGFEGLPVLQEGQVYYLCEIEAPQGYFKNDKIYKLTARKTGSNPDIYVYDITVKDDESEVIETTTTIPQRPIIYNEKGEDIDLTVEKKWQNQSGQIVVPGKDATASFKVMRYKSEEGVKTETEVVETDEDDITLRIHLWGHEDNWTQGNGGWYDGHPAEIVNEYTYHRGETIQIKFDYNWNYSQNGPLHRRYKLGKNQNWVSLQYDGVRTYNNNSPSSSGWQNITIPEEGVLDVYYVDEWIAWSDTSIPHSSYTLQGGTLGEKKKVTIIHYFPYTNWIPDNDYDNTSILTLPTNNSNPTNAWKGVFEDLPASEYIDSDNDGIPDKNIYYRYYVVEMARTPADSTIVYIDNNNSVIHTTTDVGNLPNPTSLMVDHSDTQTVINKIKTGSLDIKKTLKKDNHPDTNATGTYWFAVYEGEYDASTNSIPVAERCIEIGSEDSGTKTVTVDNLPYGTYYVYELTCQGGTPIVSNDSGTHHVFDNTVYVVSGSGAQSIINSNTPNTTEIVNSLITTEISIKKVDEANVSIDTSDYLKGAGFKLTKYEDNTFVGIDTSWESQSLIDTEKDDGTYILNGSFTFKDLLPGFYMLEETKCPNGYVRLYSNPTFQIRVKDESTEYEIIQLITGDDGYEEGSLDLIRIVDGSMIVYIGNTPGAALPNTGGPGTRLLYFLGCLLTLSAGFAMFYRKRKNLVA